MTSDASVTSPLIELRDVTLEVDGQVYLRQANLAVSAGESVIVAGLPGSGKSFVIRLMLGLPGLGSGSRTRLEGEVVVDGLDVVGTSGAELQQLRSRMGAVLRDGGLIENMDVRRNIMLPLSYHHRTSMGKTDIDERCDLLLQDLGLARLNKPGLRPVGLNREERIYVSLARALVNEPFLLLMDDPAAGLSPGCAASLKEMCFGYYPRFSTHPETQPVNALPLTRVTTTSDIGRYLSFGDRFVVLTDQQLHVIGGREEVASSSQEHVRALISEDSTERVSMETAPCDGTAVSGSLKGSKAKRE